MRREGGRGGGGGGEGRDVREAQVGITSTSNYQVQVGLAETPGAINLN